MKNLLIAFFSIVLIFSQAAIAGESPIDECYMSDQCGGPSNDVPEFNAATATLGLGLIVTIGALIRERRRRNK